MNNSRPNFDEFSNSSTARRLLVNRLFFLLCVFVAILSVVILGILLTAIVAAALPTFGPHVDHLSGTNRFVMVQSDSTDVERVDVGDLVQGTFAIESLDRGGLGSTNEETFVSDNGTNRLGIYSFEVTKKIRQSDLDVLYQLKPADGEQSVANLLARANISSGLDQSACIAVLESGTDRFELSDAEFKERLFSEDKIADLLDAEGDWSMVLLAGYQAADDYMELKLNSDSVEQLNSIGSKKKGGQLNGGLSILEFNETEKFKPVKVRSFESTELVSSQLKIDAELLRGLNSRSKNGFQLGGEFELVYCPISEKSASTWSHIAHFVQEIPKSEAPSAGIGPAIMGSVWVIIGCAIFALPIGVGTAIFLEEFKPTNRLLLMFHSLIQLNISNLAGVPSIVYGILGLTAFAWMFGVFGSVKEPGFQFGSIHYYQYLTEGSEVVLIPVDDPTIPPTLIDEMMVQDTHGNPVELNIIGEEDDFPEDDETLMRSLLSDADGGLYSKKSWYYFQLPFGRGVLAASLTLMLVILPVIIIATQEALRAVPASLREGALGLGATPWQVVRRVTLPSAIPSIMTGSILSMSRAIGEAAPILILCGIVYVASGPQHLMDTYSVLPIQIYFWTGEPVDRSLLINFQNVAAAGIVVLLAILLSFNAIAILIRQLTQKRLS